MGAWLLQAVVLWLGFQGLQNAQAAGPLPLRTPGEMGMSRARLEELAELIAPEIKAENLPGCVVAIGRTGGLVYLRAFGERQQEPTSEAMTIDTVFDMASVTKPVATATSVMHLVERGKLRLRDPVADYLPDFGTHGKEAITIEHLLTHQGGLIPDNPLADYADGARMAWERIYALSPQVEPGTEFIYTDVGFLTLGRVVQQVSGLSVADYARKYVFSPLGMDETGFVPHADLRARAAPTERRDDQWLRGQVHDPRAAALGGVAGHAGLFSTADDLAIFCDAMLRGGANAAGRALHPATLLEMTRPRDIGGALRGLGWDMRTNYSSNRGETFSARAFGHGGFTGTAVWIDPQLDLFVIFLSNRLHPDGVGNVNPLAGRIGTVAAAAIESANPSAGPDWSDQVRRPAAISATPRASSVDAAPAPPALLGVDVLRRDRFSALCGKRVGLIVNHTSRAGDGRRVIDLLHEAPDIDLKVLFSPEHGLFGKLDQSNIDDTRDEATQLPVYSLYGESRQPTPEQLKDLDALVFDIQD
ncbi:MAG: serine hydrolase, partial [Planctomycetales bacterium]|nr:serine hydrolase [Planctomycetales bacterium]